MMDYTITPENIKNIFYQQIKKVTLHSKEDSFDLQFSGTF